MIQRAISWMTVSLPVLHNRDYRIWLTGRSLTTLGTWMNGLALSWLALRMTGSPAFVGALSLAGLLPGLIILYIGGKKIENLSKKKVLIVAAMSLSFTSATAASLWYAEAMQPWHLLALAAVSGIAISVEFPTRELFLVELTRENFDQTIASEVFLSNLTRVIGMMLAGWIVSKFGEGIVFVIDASTSFLMMLAIVSITGHKEWSRNDKEGRVNGSWASEVTIPRFSILLVILFSFNFSSIFLPLQTVIVRDIYQQDVLELGMFGMMIGFGALAGSTLYLLKLRARNPVSLLVTMALVYPFVVTFVVAGTDFNAALAGLIVLGFLFTLKLNVLKTLVHMAIPHGRRASAMRLWLFAFGLNPIAGILAGSLCEFTGYPRAILAGTAMTAWIFVSGALLIFQIDKKFKSKKQRKRS